MKTLKMRHLSGCRSFIVWGINFAPPSYVGRDNAINQPIIISSNVGKYFKYVTCLIIDRP